MTVMSSQLWLIMPNQLSNLPIDFFKYILYNKHKLS